MSVHLPSREEAAEMIKAASGEVFGTMLGIELEAGEPQMGEALLRDGVSATVGIAGRFVGNGTLLLSHDAACQVAGALMGEDFETVRVEVLDAVGEVANMIIGNIKTYVEETSGAGPLGLSVPTVVFGRNYQTRSRIGDCGIRVPFSFADQKMELAFHLADNPGEAEARAGYVQTHVLTA
jgi:chemotaxis protein CheX